MQRMQLKLDSGEKTLSALSILYSPQHRLLFNQLRTRAECAQASVFFFCNWTAHWKTGMKVAKPKNEIKKRMKEEKVVRANMKPSMGSPAWETLNGV